MVVLNFTFYRCINSLSYATTDAKSRNAAQKPLLTAGVTIEFLDDQPCL